MKRYGRVTWMIGVVVLVLVAFQVSSARASSDDGSAIAKIAYVTNGVIERVVDLVAWASSEVWGSPDGARTLAAADQDGEFRWEGRLASGDVIEIKGVNGDIEAVRAPGSVVEVVAEKHARKSDPDQVRIEVIEHSAGVTICAVYPGRDNRCEPGSGGKNKVNDNDVRVSFDVRVPAGVNFRGRTVNGDVTAEGLESHVDAATVNGGLELSTTGLVEASTVNGSIEARMDGTDWEGLLEFTTVNGSIELDVPDDLDADLEASWVNGGLETDLPFTVQGRMSRRRAEGSLGSGGPDLELETVNGSIRIY